VEEGLLYSNLPYLLLIICCSGVCVHCYLHSRDVAQLFCSCLFIFKAYALLSQDLLSKVRRSSLYFVLRNNVHMTASHISRTAHS
jgi:hypothetical protein